MKVSHKLQLEWLDETHAKDAEWWPGVLMRIADGEAVQEVKDSYGLFWGPFRTWISSDAVREAEYQRAMAHAVERARSVATAGVTKMAAKRFDDAAIEPSHALRASELILGSHSTVAHVFEADRQSEAEILATMRGIVEANPGLLEALNSLRPEVAGSLTYTQAVPAGAQGNPALEKVIAPEGASTEEARK